MQPEHEEAAGQAEFWVASVRRARSRDQPPLSRPIIGRRAERGSPSDAYASII